MKGLRFKNTKTMKYLFLFRGLPSSGKTTAAELLFPKEHICSADDFFYNEEGEYVIRYSRLDWTCDRYLSYNTAYIRNSEMSQRSTLWLLSKYN